MKLTIVVEDTVYRPGLQGEHGLSILVERGGRKWLFDTGQTGTAVDNAARLGIDLREIEGVVISHGHYDHAGGLEKVVRAAGETRIFCHPEIFVKRYALERGGKKRRVGVPWTRRAIEKAGGRFIFNRMQRVLSKGLVLSGEIPVPARRMAAMDERLRVERNGRLAPDPVPDEQCLVAETAKGLVLLVGCGHRGLAATLGRVVRLCGGRKIHAVVGGLHLMHGDTRSVKPVIELLRRFDARWIAACHCTGQRAVAALREAFPRRVIACSTGDTIAIS